MASISSLGAGSGMDLAGILNNLMSVEQQPLVALQKKEASYQARISGLGSLKSVLSSLQTAAGNLLPSSTQTMTEKYSSYSAKVADTSVATATSTSSATPGTYSLKVSKLAESQRIATDPALQAFTGKDHVLGAGTLTIEFGTVTSGIPDTYAADTARTLEITLDSATATLGDLRDAINAKNGDVSATIVTGTDGAQLVLTGKKTGVESVMNITGTAGLVNFSRDATGVGASTFTQDTTKGGRAASNAEFEVNGIAATSDTNVVSDVLQGVTLTLLKTNSGVDDKETTITVGTDTTSSLTSALNAFVKSYNEVNTTLGTLGAYNAETKEAGVLQGQAIVRGTQAQLRNLAFGTVSGGSSEYQRLSDIGITVDKAGALSVNSTKLSAAMEADPDAVLGLVEKVGTAFKSATESMTGTTGTITNMTDSINRMIKDIGSQRTVINDRLLKVEERYRAQFTALDSLIAGMKQTSTYLSQQLANLPGARS